MAFVVAGAVRVGLAEVTDGDRAVDRAHDVGQANLFGWAGQYVASADASLRTDQTGTLQRQKNLLKIRLRKTGALGNVTDRGRATLIRVEGERQ